MDKKTPQYMKIVNWVNEQISERKIIPGQKMYSENELSAMFGLSRQTVRHAIEVLEKSGVVTRRRGSGTYVKDRRKRNPRENKRIALIMTYVDGYIFPRTIRSIENVLFENGYSAQICFTNNRIDRERGILEDILERNEVAGIIAEATKSGIPNPDLDLYHKIMEANIPLLFLNGFYEKLDVPYVSMNDTMAGKAATNLLIKKGHRNIAGMFKLDDIQGHKRYSGFMEAIHEAGLVCRDHNIIWYDTDDIADLELIKEKIIKRIKGCTALVVYNDEVAYALVHLFEKMGIRIPEDLSIVSIDDSELAVMGNVRLSSVPYPMERLGEKAVRNMLEMINNPEFDGKYEFDVFAVDRDSVKFIERRD